MSRGPVKQEMDGCPEEWSLVAMPRWPWVRVLGGAVVVAAVGTLLAERLVGAGPGPGAGLPGVPPWRVGLGWVAALLPLGAYLLWVLRWVTRRANEALRANERTTARFRALVEAASDGIVVEGRARFVYLNPAALRMLGAESPGQLLGEYVIDRFEPDVRGTVLERMRSVNEEGSPVGPIEVGVLRLDGGRRRVELSAVPFMLGEDRGAMVVARDVTDRRVGEASGAGEALPRGEESVRSLIGRLMSGQDEERRRLARELHDTTAQDLTAIGLGLTRVLQLLPSSGTDAARSLVSDCMGLVEQAGRDVRVLSYLLHPPLLDEMGLPAALREFVAGLVRRSGMKIRLECPEEFGRVGRDSEMALFRIAQESLANARRHAAGGQVRVSLRREGGELRLEVVDDGTGGMAAPDRLKALQEGSGGMDVGVLGMRERVRLLGGELEVSASGSGIAVRARLPAPDPVTFSG